MALMLTAFHPSPLASWYQVTLLGEPVHRSVSRLSRAISQKVCGLGNRTGDPSVSGPITYPHNYWPAQISLVEVSVSKCFIQNEGLLSGSDQMSLIRRDCSKKNLNGHSPSLWSKWDQLPLGTEQVVSSISGSVGYLSHVH